MIDDKLYDWSRDDMLEITLPETHHFMFVKDTLSRTGIVSKKEKNTLYQTAHILHKSEKYYIVHFKEMYVLDGKYSTLTYGDMKRRNAIAKKLESWGLLNIVDESKVEHCADFNDIFTVKNKYKSDWTFIQKYKLGAKND